MKKNSTLQTAVYPGTFDPITNGHIDIIERALHLFHHIVIAVAPNPKKTPLFGLKERLEMIHDATQDFSRLSIEPFEGLLVHYLRRKAAIAIIRGVRAVSDFEYEFQMALMNRQLDPEIETVFLMPSKEFTYLSSSLIKEVACHEGDVSGLVPEIVSERLQKVSFRKELGER